MFVSKRHAIFLVIMICSFLSGCVSWADYEPSALVKGAIIGAVTGGVVGAATQASVINDELIGAGIGAGAGYYLSLNSPPIKQLKDHGVQVIMVGDDVKFVLPADKIFIPGTPRMDCEYYPMLKTLIKILNCYEKITIHVAVFTDNHCEEERNISLTRQQAANLTHYLWSHGADVRILFGQGYGSQNPIATNDTPWGRKTNRRVEITLRQLPVVEE